MIVSELIRQGFERMRFPEFFRGVALAAPLFLAACGSESSFDLELVVKDCDPGGDNPVTVLPSSGTLTVVVTGDGMSPVRASASVTSGSLELPEVPVGKNRVATVEIRDSSAGGKGVLKAVGRSVPFEVEDGGSPSVQVILYRVNSFTRTRADAGACTDMSTARAGHVATLLADGRVLIAGGFAELKGQDREPTAYLTSAEIFDPATGTFDKEVPPMCQGDRCAPLAFARSVLLKDGRVLVVGGEAPEGDGAVVASKAAAIFDPAKKSWSLVEMNHARRGHTATLLEANGQVLVIGGVGKDGAVVGTVEAFDPLLNAFSVVRSQSGSEILFPRAFHVATRIDGAGISAIQLVGGVAADGSLDKSSPILSWNNSSSYSAQSSGVQIDEGVVGAGLARFTSPFRIGLAGGATTWTPNPSLPAGGTASGASKTAQWFGGHGSGALAGVKGKATMNRERINACVASLDADRALVVGGFGETGSPVASAEVLAFRPDDQATMVTALPDRQGAMRAGGRGFATCTSLGDGRVLILGGMSNGTTVTPSAEIYVAQPL